MSTRELNEWLEIGLAEQEVESTYRTNKPELDLPLDDTFDCEISLPDFTGPEIQINDNIDTLICNDNNLNSEIQHSSDDIEMSKDDELVPSELFPEGPFDCRTNST